jgi:hypothetical protein
MIPASLAFLLFQKFNLKHYLDFLYFPRERESMFPHIYRWKYRASACANITEVKMAGGNEKTVLPPRDLPPLTIGRGDAKHRAQ